MIQNGIEKIINSGDLMIITNVKVAKPDKSMTIIVRALWDTGATFTAVNYAVANQLSLPKTIEIPAQSVFDKTTTQLYSGIVCIEEVPIIKHYNFFLGSYPYSEEHNYDMVIGMDIIRLGNFCLSPINNGEQQLFRFFN